MKIEIDVSHYFNDDDSLSEVLENRIVSEIVKSLNVNRNNIMEKVHSLVVKKAETTIDNILIEFFEEPYIAANEFGSRDQPKSLRNRVSEHLRGMCTLKAVGSFGEKSKFTEAIEAVVRDCMKEFRDTFNNEVKSELIKGAIKEAWDEVGKRLQGR